MEYLTSDTIAMLVTNDDKTRSHPRLSLHCFSYIHYSMKHYITSQRYTTYAG